MSARAIEDHLYRILPYMCRHAEALRADGSTYAAEVIASLVREGYVLLRQRSKEQEDESAGA